MARARKIGLPVLLLATIAIMLTLSARRAIRAESRRAAYERNLYRAVEACHMGNMEQVALATSNAIAMAPDSSSEAFVRDFLSRMRKSDCQLVPYVEPSDGYVPAHGAP